MRMLLFFTLVVSVSSFASKNPSQSLHVSRRFLSHNDAQEEIIEDGLRIADRYLQTDYDEKEALVPSISNKELDTSITEIGGNPADVVAKWIVLGLGTCAVSIGLGEMLVQFEWFQALRYVWPLLGGLFVLEGFKNDTKILPFSMNGSGSRLVAAICGLGLIVGGAYDAFMPVWYTGPNVVTNAGLNQDSATVLLLLSVFSIAKDTIKERDEADASIRLLLQMLLLGQLYKLGEGSIDEIIGTIIGLL